MSHDHPVPFSDYLWRFGYALVGRWRPEYDPNDKPPKNRRGYFGELGHSGKNVIVEGLRKLHLYSRKGKTKPDLPYEWPK